MSKKKILIIIGLLIAWLLVVNYEKNNVETNNTNFEEGSTTKNPATGVELTLSLNSNPDTKYTSIVNDIGYAEFTDIPYGWYTITETKSLPYIDIMDPQDVYIAKDKQQLHYIVEDPRRGRELKIVKKDSETGNIIPLSGATFKVWDVSAKMYIKQTYNYPTQVEIEEFVTSNSLILSSNIALGVEVPQSSSILLFCILNENTIVIPQFIFLLIKQCFFDFIYIMIPIKCP